MDAQILTQISQRRSQKWRLLKGELQHPLLSWLVVSSCTQRKRIGFAVLSTINARNETIPIFFWSLEPTNWNNTHRSSYISSVTFHDPAAKTAPSLASWQQLLPLAKHVYTTYDRSFPHGSDRQLLGWPVQPPPPPNHKLHRRTPISSPYSIDRADMSLPLNLSQDVKPGKARTIYGPRVSQREWLPCRNNPCLKQRITPFLPG